MTFGLHEALDLAISAGLAHVYWNYLRGRAGVQAVNLPMPEVRDRPHESSTTDGWTWVNAYPPDAPHDIQILKGDEHVGWRPAGHPDLKTALETKGLRLRWPDGSYQEVP